MYAIRSYYDCGQFVFAPGTSEDRVMEVALEAGAEDVVTNEDGSVEVVCAPGDFGALREAFAKAELKPEIAEIRITSYNVCYTKLLRRVSRWSRAPTTADPRNSITSASISPVRSTPA